MQLPNETMTSTSNAALGTIAHELGSKIETRDAIVAVVGLGYVGLPLCDALQQGGLRVLGFDTDVERVAALGRGGASSCETTTRLVTSATFEASAELERLHEADVVIVCVPTPLGAQNEPDLRHVHAAARSIGRTLRRGQLIILGSTTFPGTSRDEFLPAILAASPLDLREGHDFFVAYSPEREDPGRTTHSTRTIPRLVGGLSSAAAELAVQLYRLGIDQVLQVSSCEVAEAAKLLENVYRSVNIALVNELKVLLDRMRIDVWEVIEAASTKPFGFTPFYPGPGLGGHCIPIDPFYLSWKAKQLGRPSRFIELAGEINREMPAYVVQRTLLALNDDAKALRGATVLVLGVAYKRDVSDIRESPSLDLIQRFQSLGAQVDYHDPLVPSFEALDRTHHTSIDGEQLDFDRYDAVIVATDHTAIDFKAVARGARLTIDTRNALAPHADSLRGRWVRA